MRISKPFKPCEKLTVADLTNHPVWTFDLSRAESDPRADETWIRPESFLRRPKNTDVLFIRAQLRTAPGTTVPGALLVRFESGTPVLQALAFLEPSYVAVGVIEDAVPKWARKDLKKAHPKSAGWFPIDYHAVLPIGAKAMTFSGQAT